MLPDEKPPLHNLTMTANIEEEIEATAVEIGVKISGVSHVTGSAAIHKAKEVEQMVTRLKVLGIEEKDIRFDGVALGVANLKVFKTSNVTYRLTIRVEPLTRFPEVLGVLSGQNNIEITRMNWDYGDLDALEEKLLTSCTRKANSKAKLVASELGLNIKGVHQFNHHFHAPGKEMPLPYAAAPMEMMTRSRMDADAFGTEISHTAKVSAGVHILFIVEA